MFDHGEEDSMKKWFKSRTMWLGFVIGFLGLVTGTLESAPLDPKVQGMVMAGIGALVMFLRSITSTALGSSDIDQ